MLKKLNLKISAAVICLATISAASSAIDIQSIRKVLDQNKIDILVSQDISLITANLQLSESSDPTPTSMGIGTSTHIGAYIGLERNTRISATAYFMYDGIKPVEDKSKYGANITRFGATATYDHLIPYTFHKDFRAYASGGISLSLSKYSNIHDLDWGGYASNIYSDQSLFEAGIILALPMEYSINKDIAVTLTPYTDYNFSAGMTQLVGARLGVRFW
jgi:hypothetical protein